MRKRVQCSTCGWQCQCVRKERLNMYRVVLLMRRMEAMEEPLTRVVYVWECIWLWREGVVKSQEREKRDNDDEEDDAADAEKEREIEDVTKKRKKSVFSVKSAKRVKCVVCNMNEQPLPSCHCVRIQRSSLSMMVIDNHYPECVRISYCIPAHHHSSSPPPFFLCFSCFAFHIGVFQLLVSIAQLLKCV